MATSNGTDLKNQVNLYDCLTILFLALLTNAISELLSWVFIYRKKKYKECKKQIDFLNKKIENSKAKTKNLDKKVKQQEVELKNLNAEMMKVIYLK
jgi:hypothetical protein